MPPSAGDSFHPSLPPRGRGINHFAIGRFILGPDPTPPVPQVAGFEIVRFIARGSLGQVWEAVRTGDGRPVALKVAADSHPGISERLAAEAETLRVLQHPNIVRLLDLTATADERPVLVLEFVDGPTLAGHLPEAGFDFDHALQILLPVLDAVEHAHGRGIIHRDLKPANILIGTEGLPKVADFGLALPLKDRLVIFGLTRSGAVAGTVEYLAPECYEPGYQPTAFADIYALGVLLYELLTGTPPRGAWLPLSQIRKLDIRLDELLAETIAPDPARRLSSARRFRERLEEIRASPRRLAGTPLVNRAVRGADLFWTVAGLYLCAAGFCATLSQTRTPVPALFDLTFSSPGLLLRGFLAVWTLSLGIGILWLWQLFRLWRFRRVPLRESLPSPFGMKLGSGPMAAFLVGAAQLFCVWLPPVFALVVMGQSFHWLAPETPIWDKFLVVTPWMTDEPVSPWLWHPSKMLDGGTYWLKEALHGYEPGVLRVIDKTSFFIFGQPFLMALSAVITITGMAVTGGRWLRSWWKGRRIAALAGGVAALTVGLWVTAGVRADIREWRYPTPAFAEHSANERIMHSVYKVIHQVFRNRFLHEGEPVLNPNPLRDIFAERVSWISGEKITLDTLEDLLATDRRQALSEGRHIAPVGSGSGYKPTGSVEAEWKSLIYTDPPDAPATADLVTWIWRGEMPAPSHIKINFVGRKVLPFYKAVPVPLSAEEGQAFLEQWAAVLSSGAASALEASFAPHVLTENTLRPSAELLAVLQAERSKWADFTLTVTTPPPEPERLPGARWRLRPLLHQEGRRRGEQVSGISPPFTWMIDIAHIESRWRIVGFSFEAD